MTADVVLIIVIGALVAWGIWLFASRVSGLLVEIVAEVRALRKAAEQ